MVIAAMIDKTKIIQTAAISCLIGVLSPMMWVLFLGTTSRTPTMERAFFDGLSSNDIEAWIQSNSTPLSFGDHAVSIIQEFMKEPTQYIEASLSVFLAVFIINLLILAKK